MLNIQGVSTFVAGQGGAAGTGGVCQDRLEITVSTKYLSISKNVNLYYVELWKRNKS